jgi:2-methylcitrate dehydratase PrpD
MFGSMAKSFQPGRAAQNGITAALLAQADFSAGERALEGPRGFAAVTAAHYDLAKIETNLGQSYELADNAYKPYACGLVVHPTIDGASQLRARHALAPAKIRAVHVRVAPLVLDLCNQRDLDHRALKSKYSIYHAAAIGLVRGKGGLKEFTAEAVADPDIRRVRERVTAVADERVGEDQAAIEVEMDDGTRYELFVEESLGNVRRPLTNPQLEAKFLDQAVFAVSEVRARELVQMCWSLESLPRVADVVAATVPESAAAQAAGAR